MLPLPRTSKCFLESSPESSLLVPSNTCNETSLASAESKSSMRIGIAAALDMQALRSVVGSIAAATLPSSSGGVPLTALFRTSLCCCCCWCFVFNLSFFSTFPSGAPSPPPPPPPPPPWLPANARHVNAADLEKVPQVDDDLPFLPLRRILHLRRRPPEGQSSLVLVALAAATQHWFLFLSFVELAPNATQSQQLGDAHGCLPLTAGPMFSDCKAMDVTMRTKKTRVFRFAKLLWHKCVRLDPSHTCLSISVLYSLCRNLWSGSVCKNCLTTWQPNHSAPWRFCSFAWNLHDVTTALKSIYQVSWRCAMRFCKRKGLPWFASLKILHSRTTGRIEQRCVRACVRARVAGRERREEGGFFCHEYWKTLFFFWKPATQTDWWSTATQEEGGIWPHTIGKRMERGTSCRHTRQFLYHHHSFCSQTRPAPASASPSLLFALLSVSKSPCHTPYHISSKHQACLLAVFLDCKRKLCTTIILFLNPSNIS